MKVTYNEILSAKQALEKLMGNGSDASVSPLAALRLARAARVIGQEAEAFEAGRIALIKKCVSEPDEKGHRVVPPEQLGAFGLELQDLAKQEIEIDVQPLSLADFGESQVGLTALVGLEWLIEDEGGRAG